MISIDTIQTYASNVAHTPVVIACEADATFPKKLDGYVLRGADGTVLNVLHMRQSICDDARALDRKRVRFPSSYTADAAGHRADLKSGYALGMILHEAIHVSLNSVDEGQVDCITNKNNWALVKQFKQSSWISGMLLAGMQWRHENMDPEYRTVC